MQENTCGFTDQYGSQVSVAKMKVTIRNSNMHDSSSTEHYLHHLGWKR
jgi:hypothetical protein